MNGSDNDKPWGIELKAYCLLMHLSQLTSFIFPGLGFAIPVVMWATNKSESSVVDQHGRNIINWLLTLLIGYVVCWLLTFVYIGFVGLMVLALLNIIFAIIAAVKANKGEVWAYPFSIQFMKS